MFGFLFVFSAISASDDDEISNARDILRGKWQAEISRTDSDGNHDETEDESVEVRFNGKRGGKKTTFGVYPDSLSSSESFYNATLIWDKEGNIATVVSDGFEGEVEFMLLTKYEARGTSGNIRYLFEINDAENAHASITFIDTDEKIDITLFREYSFFETDIDWKSSLPTIIFVAVFLSIVIFCKSPEGKKIEEEENRKYKEEAERKKKAKAEKKEAAREKQFLHETL